ncbi:Transposon Ty3-I Gag-Pol polyprotein [Gossypium australe]|uniref:Transposon Ty3-I Gag-Pol polyprotein n=1 Tax=Gossypium australe TaxID=47621 RepID=A0A5B6WHJ1_9ROSI|nr:Transposon Ty3-I Gag-Pol polyprotein [Gossypium australe]
MHTGHLLLGRPWQFDWRVKHDRFSNQYSFKHKGKNITLALLSLQQVMEDQQRLRQSMESLKEKNKESKRSVEEKRHEKEFEKKKRVGEKEMRMKKKSEKNKNENESERKRKDHLTKELRLQYPVNERKFVLKAQGKTDPDSFLSKGKQCEFSKIPKQLHWVPSEDFVRKLNFGKVLHYVEINYHSLDNCLSILDDEIVDAIIGKSITQHPLQGFIVRNHEPEGIFHLSACNLRLLSRCKEFVYLDNDQMKLSPITRAQLKRFQDAVATLMSQLWDETQPKGKVPARAAIRPRDVQLIISKGLTNSLPKKPSMTFTLAAHTKDHSAGLVHTSMTLQAPFLHLHGCSSTPLNADNFSAKRGNL